jgi:hypothetical protein
MSTQGGATSSTLGVEIDMPSPRGQPQSFGPPFGPPQDSAQRFVKKGMFAQTIDDVTKKKIQEKRGIPHDQPPPSRPSSSPKYVPAQASWPDSESLEALGEASSQAHGTP